MKWYEKLFMALIFGMAVCGCPARATSKFTPMVCEGPLDGGARCKYDYVSACDAGYLCAFARQVDAGCVLFERWDCAPINFPRPYAEFSSVFVPVPP